MLWLVHPPLLSWGLRFALVRAASEAGLQLEIGNIQADLARPIIFEGLRFRAKNAGESQTAADVGRIEVSLNWPWHAFFREGRFFRSLVAEDIRGVVDLRPDPVFATQARGRFV